MVRKAGNETNISYGCLLAACAASQVDMSKDPNRPHLFTMSDWISVRDQLFHEAYAKNGNINKYISLGPDTYMSVGEVTHRTCLTFLPYRLTRQLAIKMNEMQENYLGGCGLTTIGVSGRTFAEVSNFSI